jgi:monoterpene epsilon-lactone hydrolase
MKRLIVRSFTSILLAAFIPCCAVVTQSQSREQNIGAAVPVDAPAVPQMVVDANGTLHFVPRTVPLPALASPEARRAYTEQMLRQAQASAAHGGQAFARSTKASAAPAPGWSKQAALKIYQVVEESQKIGGVGVTIYSPKVIPAKNRNRVVMEFEMDAEAIAVASLAQLKVIKVNYRGGGASIPGNEDIVAVYRELLKTYKPKSIGMFGASGGCTLAQTTILWLPQLKLPLPGAVGLNTCSGGSNPGDSRFTLNGLDAALSSAFSGRPPTGDATQLPENRTSRRPRPSMATSPKATHPLFCLPAPATCA